MSARRPASTKSPTRSNSFETPRAASKRGGLIAASIASVALAVWQHNRAARREAAAVDEEEDTDF